MAFTKKEKTELIAQYEELLKNSQALVALSYNKMNMKEIDTLRAKVRDAGGEMHVIKNTLMKLAMEKAGYTNFDVFKGLSLVGFALNDPAALAKTLNDATAKSEVFEIKGGYLGTEMMDAKQIKNLAELPPLPVLQATLLGTLLAPASKLVRTLAEPARGLAAVLKAHSEST
ncbi:MAG TPA: 50S ribosomal protein L10, partial [Bellilinea sp.]|nr:50S ribosomal protein L10 [Bellilinea sp.]